jgi:ubiquinone/menaquinone biosynthesis C-methylase UbiE
MESLKWTGERMMADYAIGKGAIEHLHRYAIVQSLIKDKIVLDIASGEGYGSNLMAQKAAHVTGVDISREAVQHAGQKYVKGNLRFIDGSITSIPLEDHSVDVIVSFETLEHHDQHDQMMHECKRVLKNDGLLVISTPEKDNYKKIDPFNPYHIKEVTLHEFEHLLKTYFSYVNIFHQRFLGASFIYPVNKSILSFEEYTGNFSGIKMRSFQDNHFFNIAVCSNDPSFKPNMQASFFDSDNYIKEKQDEMNIAFETQLREAVKKVRQSNSYKLGNLLLLPLSTIKRWLWK